jgi:hypothetical protein
MPAQVEEVVVDADGIDAEELRPISDKGAFELVSRFGESARERGTGNDDGRPGRGDWPFPMLRIAEDDHISERRRRAPMRTLPLV